MEKSQVLLFTSPTCPNCPMAKDFIQKKSLERDDFEYQELSSFDPKGRKLAQKYEVRSVPTFIIKGPNYDKNIGFIGTPTTNKFNELIDLSLGIIREEEKKDRVLKIGKFNLKF